METNNRRDFLKKAALAGASALVAPSLFAADGEGRGELSLKIKAGDLESKLIVPKNNGLKITGTFLDEISHDIPHQNWGEKEWDLDFQHMKRIGIDTDSFHMLKIQIPFFLTPVLMRNIMRYFIQKSSCNF